MSKVYKNNKGQLFTAFEDTDYSEILIDDLQYQGMDYISIEYIDNDKVKSLFDLAFADDMPLLPRLQLFNKLDNNHTVKHYSSITAQLEDIQVYNHDNIFPIDNDTRDQFISELSYIAYDYLFDTNWRTIETLLNFLQDNKKGFKWLELLGYSQGEIVYLYGVTDIDLNDNKAYYENIFFNGQYLSIAEIDEDGDTVETIETLPGADDELYTDGSYLNYDTVAEYMKQELQASYFGELDGFNNLMVPYKA